MEHRSLRARRALFQNTVQSALGELCVASARGRRERFAFRECPSSAQSMSAMIESALRYTGDPNIYK